MRFYSHLAARLRKGITAFTQIKTVATNLLDSSGYIRTQGLADNILSADALGRGKMQDSYLTNTKINNNEITSKKLAFALKEKIYDSTLTNATNLVEITGLDLNVGKEYILIINQKNDNAANSSTNRLWLYQATNLYGLDTDYYSQYLDVNGTAISANRENLATISGCPANGSAIHLIYMYLSYDGYPRSIIFHNNLVSTVAFTYRCNVKNYVGNVTQLKIESNLADGLGIGTRIMLFKVSA
ncbi:MAG: hypothetical protein AB1779_04875 [Candidatus Thermoplasmatota archaeon]